MTCSATKEARRKEMNTTLRGHSLRVTVVMALFAVLLLLAVVFALQPAPTTGDHEANPANRAMSAESTGGSRITDDPYIERHAEVVERLGNGRLR